MDQLSYCFISYCPLQVGIGEASTAREAQATGTCEEMRDHQRPHPMAHEHHHQQQQHHHAHHQMATTAFHISRPSHPISTIISPPPLHHTSIILDQDPYHVPRIMLQNDNFQVIKQPHYLSSAFDLLLQSYSHSMCPKYICLILNINASVENIRKYQLMRQNMYFISECRFLLYLLILLSETIVRYIGKREMKQTNKKGSRPSRKLRLSCTI